MTHPKQPNRRTDDPADKVRIVKNWHESLNDGDVDRLVALSHPDIEVGGPRGTGSGAQLLREWMDHANIRLEPRRVFHQAETVVMEQKAEWRSAETGQVIGSQTVASIFVARDNCIVSVLRYDTLDDALSTANLDESHEAQPD